LAVASLLQDLSVGRFTGVADGAAGGSAASVVPPATSAKAATTVLSFMRALS
jgi:hypothetical protein